MTENSRKVNVRRMTDDDLMKVNQIDRLLFGDDRVSTWQFSFDSYWNIYGPGVNFVAEVDGEVIGFLAGNIAEQERTHSILDLMHTVDRSSRFPKIGWIDMVGILPSYQGMHVGQALVEAFHQECKQNGAPMRAIVKEEDKRLNGFLESVGFKKWTTATYEKE